MSDKPQPKLVRTGRYTLELEEYDDGTYKINRHNAGIHSIYLLGMLDIARSDIHNQIAGKAPFPVATKTSSSEPITMKDHD